MNAHDLITFVEELDGHGLNPDEGVLFGDPTRHSNSVLLTWMPTVKALEHAAVRKIPLVLCHEAFYLRPQGRPLDPHHLTWRANRRRVETAVRGTLTILRIHTTLDRICIWDDFVAALGVRDPNPGTGWNKVLPIDPKSVGELVQHCKNSLGLETVRVCGDADTVAKRAGFPWGGLGLDSNLGYVQRCIELGAEVLVAGECDEYGMTLANDSGVPMIETGHAVSETIGLVTFRDRLANAFPDIRFEVFEDTRPYRFA